MFLSRLQILVSVRPVSDIYKATFYNQNRIQYIKMIEINNNLKIPAASRQHCIFWRQKMQPKSKVQENILEKICKTQNDRYGFL